MYGTVYDPGCKGATCVSGRVAAGPPLAACNNSGVSTPPDRPSLKIADTSSRARCATEQGVGQNLKRIECQVHNLRKKSGATAGRALRPPARGEVSKTPGLAPAATPGGRGGSQNIGRVESQVYSPRGNQL